MRHRFGAAAVSQRREPANVREEHAVVHLQSPDRTLVEALGAEPRILPRWPEADAAHQAAARPSERRATDGAAGIARQLAHDPYERADAVRLDCAEELLVAGAVFRLARHSGYRTPANGRFPCRKFGEHGYVAAVTAVNPRLARAAAAISASDPNTASTSQGIQPPGGDHAGSDRKKSGPSVPTAA